MSLKTPEDKSKALKWVWSQIKMYIVSVTAGLGTIWGIAQIYLEDYIDQRIEINKEIDHQQNRPLREIIGEENSVPLEIVPYYISDQLIKIDSIEYNIIKFETKYIPFLENQMLISPMYRYLDENGVEYWMGPDRQSHGVIYDDENRPWVVYHGSKRYI